MKKNNSLDNKIIKKQFIKLVIANMIAFILVYAILGVTISVVVRHYFYSDLDKRSHQQKYLKSAWFYKIIPDWDRLYGVRGLQDKPPIFRVFQQELLVLNAFPYALVLLKWQIMFLEYLVRNKEIIITREQLFNRIWGFDSDTIWSVVEVYISGLRKVLKEYGYAKYLKTLRSVGYMWSEKE